MKTKLQKLKDIDFRIKIITIIVCGISLIFLIALNIYTPNDYYWPLYILVVTGALFLVWELIYVLLATLKYNSYE